MRQVTKTYGEERPSYFVMAEGGKAPSKRHASRVNASKEAQRLAHKHPGKTFHVVKLKESFHATEEPNGRNEQVVGGEREGMIGGEETGIQIGDVLKRMAIGAIAGVLADAIRDGARSEAGEAMAEADIEPSECDMDDPNLTDEERAENAATLAAARDRAKRYANGTEVIIIGRISPLPGLIPHQLVRGTYRGEYTPDDRFAMVEFKMDSDDAKTEERRVNLSRIFLEDDEEIRALVDL
ncbi:hypothetical protein [Erythrobacter phage vB_EliS-L02]|nr:hypothetical protein [Erythrobacter phage vB_EliS-L02]